MLQTCPKCNSSFIQIRQGISQCDRKGEWYSYEYCVMCSFVQPVRNARDERVYRRELVERVGDCIHGNRHVIRQRSGDVPRSLGPK